MLGMLRHGLRSRSCIIDGEAVACDDNGVASFDLIRHQRANAGIFLYAFDLIELNGDDIRRDPLQVRKATLASIVAKASPGIRFNEHIEGEGPTVFAHACKMSLEGIVSKRKDSAYCSGRSRDWLKMKNPFCAAVTREAEGGWGEMTRRKREIIGLRNEQDFQYLVELALPPGGFGSIFLEIDAFHLSDASQSAAAEVATRSSHSIFDSAS
jgi:ATP-dependent DNA ligase